MLCKHPILQEIFLYSQYTKYSLVCLNFCQKNLLGILGFFAGSSIHLSEVQYAPLFYCILAIDVPAFVLWNPSGLISYAYCQSAANIHYGISHHYLASSHLFSFLPIELIDVCWPGMLTHHKKMMVLSTTMQVLGQCCFCNLSWGIVFIEKTKGKHLVQEFFAILNKIILLMSANESSFLS